MAPTITMGGSHRDVKEVKAHIEKATKYFRLEHWPAVMFDLDTSLARYRLRELHQLCYERVVKALSKKNDYKDIVFRPYGDIDEQFAQRGIFYDRERGNVIKVDENGDIIQCWHGLCLLDNAERDDIYAGCVQLNLLKAAPKLRKEGDPVTKPIIHCFGDHFTVSTIYLLMELNEQYLCGERIHYGFERHFRHIMEAYDEIFDKHDFRKGDAGFYAALKADPGKYIHQPSLAFGSFLTRLKAAGMARIVITNSAPDFANFLLEFLYGEEWRKHFDAVIYDAKKPYFFTWVKRPFYWVNDTTGEIGPEADPKQFRCPVFVSQGSWFHIKDIVNAVTSKLSHDVLYMGSSLVDELYACQLLKRRIIFAVVEEREEKKESILGHTLGTYDKPSFWRKKIDEWAMFVLHSVENLSYVHTWEDIRVSTPGFIVNRNHEMYPR